MIKNIFFFFLVCFCFQKGVSQAEIKFVNPTINGTNYQVSIAIKSSVANTSFQLGNVTLRVLYDNAPFSGLPNLLAGHDFNGTIITNASNHNFTTSKGLFNIGVSQNGITVIDSYKVLGTLEFSVSNNTALLDTTNKISLSMGYPQSSIVKIENGVESNATIINNPISYITPIGGVKISAKVFLNHASGGMMSTYIPSISGYGVPQDFPLSDPYMVAPLNSSFVHVNNGATQMTTTTVLNANNGTDNDIVDWVFLELRTGTSGSTTVAYTQAALLQADGDIVKASDGISAVEFPNATSGNYYITVRHRNHLGFRTSATHALGSVATSYNFTNSSVMLYGGAPTISVGSLKVMIGGDADHNGEIASADYSIWSTQNLLGLFDDYSAIADFNLDGEVGASDNSVWSPNNSAGYYQELD